MPDKKIIHYKRVLQTEFSLTDNQWSFELQDLPNSGSNVNGSQLIKSIELISNPKTHKLELGFVKLDSNRAISGEPLDHLLHFSFADFRLGEIIEDVWKPFTAKESADYLARLLKSGITINKVLYSFYGHSSSQLKSRSCYLLRGSQSGATAKVEALGDFSKIKTVAKKAKRIGLLFSSCHTVMQVPEERCKDIDDIENFGYTFTDGCGLISKIFVETLARKMPIVVRNRRYLPSVLQIRYRGYKGVVTLEPQMIPGRWLELRKSMRKFVGTKDLSFAVVEFSKPYTYGYLNDDIILLLHSLGVTADVLLRKQEEHFRYLQEAMSDPSMAFRLLCSLNRMDAAEKLLMEGVEEVGNTVKSIVFKECEKMLNKRDDQRCRILVPQSRLVFGVCDPRAVLKPGECFVRVTLDEHTDSPRTITDTEVLVTRNPCLHPGDLRKLKAVNRPELSHLTDCIVFPVVGKRPAVDQMSGGDLDGDTFFVCWDKDLVPSVLSEPAEYPPGKEALSFTAITTDDRIDYLARYTSASLGRVKKVFLQWAMVGGPLSSECQELNRLHSLCVDGNKVRIPQRLENAPPVSSESQEKFILNVLHADATERSRQTLATRPNFAQWDSREFVETILCGPRACPEFEMVKLVLCWCRKNHRLAQLSDFLLCLDLNALSDNQRHWLLQELPPTAEYPSLVMNGLRRSAILQPTELSPYHLDYPGIRWKCAFSSIDDRMSNLFEALERSFHLFQHKLIVFGIHDRLSVAIYVPRIILKEDDCIVGGDVRVFAFPHSHREPAGHRRVVKTGVECCLYFDSSKFELYDRKRSNTFIWIGRAANDDSAYRHVSGTANRDRERQKTILSGLNHDWAASIALNKFSSGLQQHIGRVRREGIVAAEIYVISNTDLESFKTLNLWLASVDTMETQPIFERAPPPFEISRVSGINWSLQPLSIIQIVRERNFQLLDEQNIRQVLQFCFENDGEEELVAIYRHFLRSTDSIKLNVSAGLLERLIDFLVLNPNMAIFFARLCPWTENVPDNLLQILLEETHISEILIAIVQATNEMGEFVLKSFRDVLKEVASMSVPTYRELVETISLTVQSPELVLDLFLECLQPHSTRLLPEAPVITDYFVRNLLGIVLDHSDEANEQSAPGKELWLLIPISFNVKSPLLKSERRIDAPQMDRLSVGDHVRFTLARHPENMFLRHRPSFDALVESAQPGLVKFRCLQHPPTFLQQARWKLNHCGSFITSKAMLDALTEFVEKKVVSCGVYSWMMSNFPAGASPAAIPALSNRADLNESQNQAVSTAVKNPLTCIWGPPGTGKTRTIVAILQELLALDPERRVLVTAPTHNAVDNVLRKYLELSVNLPRFTKPIRVSTDVYKVASDLTKYTCDAMVGKDINQAPEARRKAVERIRESRLIFTTCAGAGLGLLRGETFMTVIIDEASQQTEPMSLIPLVKGCDKAILAGDHVQLTATIRHHAKAIDFEVSLFERLYTAQSSDRGGQVSKVMLDVQYRMHPQICNFPSTEFYQGKLRSDTSCENIRLPPSLFPWEKARSTMDQSLAQCVFVSCAQSEDLGQRSKSNDGQARLCQEIYRLLTTRPPPLDTPQASEKARFMDPPSITVLTPYTRQARLLQQILPPSAMVSSIDGYQGQEADIIIYVTVRCNLHGEIGFLKDLRRLNVALTRAKAGIVIIGDEHTLKMSHQKSHFTTTTLTSLGAPSATRHDDMLKRSSIGIGGGEYSEGNNSNNDDGSAAAATAHLDEESRRTWSRLVDSMAKLEIEIPQQDPHNTNNSLKAGRSPNQQ